MESNLKNDLTTIINFENKEYTKSQRELFSILFEIAEIYDKIENKETKRDICFNIANYLFPNEITKENVKFHYLINLCVHLLISKVDNQRFYQMVSKKLAIYKQKYLQNQI